MKFLKLDPGIWGEAVKEAVRGDNQLIWERNGSAID